MQSLPIGQSRVNPNNLEQTKIENQLLELTHKFEDLAVQLNNALEKEETTN